MFQLVYTLEQHSQQIGGFDQEVVHYLLCILAMSLHSYINQFVDKQH